MCSEVIQLARRLNLLLHEEESGKLIYKVKLLNPYNDEEIISNRISFLGDLPNGTRLF
jgi:hypothetical protein